MKKLILSALFLSALSDLVTSGLSQSVGIRIIANDGSAQTTNNVNVPAAYLSGLIAAWQDDSKAKTNASPPAAALSLSAFVAQELATDKAQEWRVRGNLEAIRTLSASLGGPTNDMPTRLVERWHALSAQQRTNAIQHLILLQ